MSLDLTRLAPQVSNMVARMKDARLEREQHLRLALETFGSNAIDLDDLKKKISAGRTTWLVAELVEGLGGRYRPSPTPTDFTVMASDGSHIDVDRHHSTRCYLINIGSAVISYGSRPDAILSSHPSLYSDDKELVITPPEGGREQMVEGTILGLRRSVEECSHLSDIASGLPAGSSALAMLDGTLILWGLEAYPEFVTDTLLTNGLLRCLDKLRELNGDRRLAVASYISFPRSTDVVNALRVAICPHQAPDCDRFCPPGKEKGCAGVEGIRDRDLFMELLDSGERSSLFISPSKIVKEHYGEHRVYFFYLRLDDEVARIEVPQWVAENSGLLELAHSLVLDQCRRGHGYPVVLSESHEQAVVTGADRENFWEFVEALMAEERLPAPASAKSLSKKTRWI